MYEDYYGFVHSPFTLAPDARFFYLSAPHEDALQQLLHSIRRRERFIVLTGDIGTGTERKRHGTGGSVIG